LKPGGHKTVITVAGLLAAAESAPGSAAAGAELVARLREVLDKELRLQVRILHRLCHGRRRRGVTRCAPAVLYCR
jgi:hypothetical protein